MKKKILTLTVLIGTLILLPSLILAAETPYSPNCKSLLNAYNNCIKQHKDAPSPKMICEEENQHFRLNCVTQKFIP